ncbi:Putative membrane-associated [Archangium gephyra]|uniref:Membrane-associated n=1 Tax=Archangium gephyra TaxID=48 RepID=A0AAC8QES9_9BACT|nr:Putative membrane-associated [Archangium gephyra]
MRDLEVTANNFAIRVIRMAQVRSSYIEQIREMSQSIRAAVEAGELTAEKGAKLANEARNQILEMQRHRDLDLGRALAQQLKDKGLTLEKAIAKAMEKLGLKGRPFQSLDGNQQRQVFQEVIESSGRSRPSVTQKIPRLRWAARGLWIATLAIAAYNIGTAENPWWQTGRETASVAGGLGGSFVGGAAMGAAGGIWAGPVGVAVGALVGGILGAMLADHAYVESAGTSDPRTRQFVSRFTNFWTGVDEAGMARALAREQLTNPRFVQAVFQSLDHDYTTDADDIALEFVRLARQDATLTRQLRQDRSLRELLIRLLDEGWTSAQEQETIQYLRRL